MKVRIEDNGTAMINCPGCKRTHVLFIKPSPHAWEFNGDVDKPTFAPSLLVTMGCRVKGARLREDGKCGICEDAKERGVKSVCGICHSFIRNGMIEFLSDCTHDMAGKTVPLDDYDGVKI